MKRTTFLVVCAFYIPWITSQFLFPQVAFAQGYEENKLYRISFNGNREWLGIWIPEKGNPSEGKFRHFSQESMHGSLENSIEESPRSRAKKVEKIDELVLDIMPRNI